MKSTSICQIIPLGGGGADVQCVLFLVETFAKTKELVLAGGGGGEHAPAAPPPLGSATGNDIRMFLKVTDADFELILSHFVTFWI